MRAPVCYEIRVKGHIRDSWSAWFEGLSLRHAENGETVLRGDLVDRPRCTGFWYGSGI